MNVFVTSDQREAASGEGVKHSDRRKNFDSKNCCCEKFYRSCLLFYEKDIRMQQE